MDSINKFIYHKRDDARTSKILYQECASKGVERGATCATFHAAMRNVVITGQCFGLNPVIGVWENDASKLRFTHHSKRYLYSILSIVGQFALMATCALKLCKDANYTVLSSASIVFFTSNFLTTAAFLKIAKQWPRLCQYISRTEALDPIIDYSIITKCKLACYLVFSLALVEHTLAVLSGIALAIDCQPERNLYEAFITQSFPWVFELVSYNKVLGVFIQFINIQCTFNWNFSDLFIICISFYLNSRLKQVSQRIFTVQGKYMPSSFWRLMRDDYSRAVSLVRKVGNVIEAVVFISFANNMFFVCLQLLPTLSNGIDAAPKCQHGEIDRRPFKGYEHSVYFMYSFLFLVTRSLAVSLIASKVNSTNRLIAYALYDVPSNAYGLEVQRFLNQIHSETVALTGLQFFNVKRGLILSIAGTIITYELVLLQFTGVTATTASSIKV